MTWGKSEDATVLKILVHFATKMGSEQRKLSKNATVFSEQLHQATAWLGSNGETAQFENEWWFSASERAVYELENLHA